MSSTKVTLKLLIDRSSKKVLFAEAGKDFVDFLFNLLALPVGTVIRLLTKNSMVGSLGNLYGSIEALDDTYMQSIHTKDSLLKPKPSASAAYIPLLPANSQTYTQAIAATSQYFYTCSNYPDCCSRSHLTTDPKMRCPSCHDYTLSRKMSFIGGHEKKEDEFINSNGFVKGVVTYMVMDDLVVKPMSTISSITVLNKFNIKDVGALEEKVVDLDMAQGLKLLKASLESERVLTSVFL